MADIVFCTFNKVVVLIQDEVEVAGCIPEFIQIIEFVVASLVHLMQRHCCSETDPNAEDDEGGSNEAGLCHF